VNSQRVYRLYREERLAVRRRKRQRVAVAARTRRALPVRANEVWTMDFTPDALASGRKFRTLNLMDGYTREALAIAVDTSLPGARVVRVLEQLRQRRGVPERIRVDHGTECSSRVADQWAFEQGVALHFIEPGKPTPNAPQRKLPRQVSRRVLERELVYELGGGTNEDRGVAEGLQPGAPAQRAGVSDAGGVRGPRRRARGVSPHAPRLHNRGVDFTPGTHIMIGTENGGRSGGKHPSQ